MAAWARKVARDPDGTTTADARPDAARPIGEVAGQA
jgi:hypothetical protein